MERSRKVIKATALLRTIRANGLGLGSLPHTLALTLFTMHDIIGGFGQAGPTEEHRLGSASQCCQMVSANAYSRYVFGCSKYTECFLKLST